ncbi:MAG: FAD:protein FMN transferase [Casimicrobiaceae bacterium]
MDLYRFEFIAMGGSNELQLWGEERGVRAAAAAAIADVRRIEAKYSRYRPDSVTSAISRAAGRAPVPIDDETAALLDYADRCYALSGGAFDVTSGVLRKAWAFGAPQPSLPDRATLARLTALVGWSRVRRETHAVFLPTSGMELDFGGFGKEYAADRAATCCIEHGIVHGLVNLGGDVQVIGPQPDGRSWRVGIRHPRSTAVAATVALAAGALATSGDYERYLEFEGRRYCHVLDARTGWPVGTWQSVSVATSVCMVAGACATIAMLLGEDGPTFLEEQAVDYLMMRADGSVRGPLGVRTAA